VDAAKVVPDESKTLLDGAIQPWVRHGPRLLREALEEVAARQGFSLEVPFRELPKKARQALLQGDGTFPGALPYLRKRVEALLRVGPQEGDEPAEPRGGSEAFE